MPIGDVIRYPFVDNSYADAMALADWDEEHEAIKLQRQRLLRQEQNLHALFMSLPKGDPQSDFVEEQLEIVREALDDIDDVNGMVLNRTDDIVAFGDSPT